MNAKHELIKMQFLLALLAHVVSEYRILPSKPTRTNAYGVMHWHQPCSGINLLMQGLPLQGKNYELPLR